MAEAEEGTLTTTTWPRLKVVVEGIVLPFPGLPEAILSEPPHPSSSRSGPEIGWIRAYGFP